MDFMYYFIYQDNSLIELLFKFDINITNILEIDIQSSLSVFHHSLLYLVIFLLEVIIIKAIY